VRRHLDDRVIQRRARLWKAIHPHSDRPSGLWWKSGIGCGKTRCQLCHPEKYPKRIPTRQELA